MPINTDFLVRCINTLASAFEQLQQREPSDDCLRHLPGGFRQRV